MFQNELQLNLNLKVIHNEQQLNTELNVFHNDQQTKYKFKVFHNDQQRNSLIKPVIVILCCYVTRILLTMNTIIA